MDYNEWNALTMRDVKSFRWCKLCTIIQRNALTMRDVKSFRWCKLCTIIQRNALTMRDVKEFNDAIINTKEYWECLNYAGCKGTSASCIGENPVWNALTMRDVKKNKDWFDEALQMGMP